jgi:hypothetical protein
MSLSVNLIQSIQYLSPHFQNGKGAIKHEHKDKINVTVQPYGSINLDPLINFWDASKKEWDYLIPTNSTLVFIEVHPAAQKNIKEIIEKYDSLQEFIRQKIPQIHNSNLIKKYIWISTNGMHFPKSGNAYKLLQKLKKLNIDNPREFITVP